MRNYFFVLNIWNIKTANIWNFHYRKKSWQQLKYLIAISCTSSKKNYSFSKFKYVDFDAAATIERIVEFWQFATSCYLLREVSGKNIQIIFFHNMDDFLEFSFTSRKLEYEFFKSKFQLYVSKFTFWNQT